MAEVLWAEYASFAGVGVTGFLQEFPSTLQSGLHCRLLQLEDRKEWYKRKLNEKKYHGFRTEFHFWVN